MASSYRISKCPRVIEVDLDGTHVGVGYSEGLHQLGNRLKKSAADDIDWLSQPLQRDYRFAGSIDHLLDV